ncbi:MAG: type VI secretion system tip protein TssI/VgrG, partial [Myxococcota bacterium]
MTIDRTVLRTDTSNYHGIPPVSVTERKAGGHRSKTVRIPSKEHLETTGMSLKGKRRRPVATRPTTIHAKDRGSAAASSCADPAATKDRQVDDGQTEDDQAEHSRAKHGQAEHRQTKHSQAEHRQSGADWTSDQGSPNRCGYADKNASPSKDAPRTPPPFAYALAATPTRFGSRQVDSNKQVPHASKAARSCFATPATPSSSSAGPPSNSGFAAAAEASFGPRSLAFSFESDAYPDERIRVPTLELEEELNRIYRAEFEVLIEEDLLCLPNLIGESARLTADTGYSKLSDSFERVVHGVVTGVTHLGQAYGYSKVRIELVPALAALDQQRSSRVFQDKTAVEIVKEVVEAGLKPFGRDIKLELREEYFKREYCVQYQETDLSFVMRLLEDEGIAFRFEQGESYETVVLSDNNSAFPELPTQSESVRIRAMGGFHDEESIHEFALSRQLTANKTISYTYDWSRPKAQIEAEAKVATHGKGLECAKVVHDEPRASCWNGDSYRNDDTDARAQREAARTRLKGEFGEGKSDLVGLTPGTVLSLEGHADPDVDGCYLVVSAVHEVQLQTKGKRSESGPYRNRFRCVPLTVRYVPEQRTTKPRSLGMQTATVVGPNAEEPYVDAYGRIRIQFHWDFDDAAPERCGCWVRMMQSWAGAGFGSMVLPRAGMEVLIDFE